MATQARSEEQSTNTSEYRVLVDQLVYRFGRGRGNVTRAGRGAIVKLDSTLVDIENLLRLKAIQPKNEKPAPRTTPAVAAAAAGADDDPAGAPDANIISSADPDAPKEPAE